MGGGVKKRKAKWYAVHHGRAPGVYRTWAEAEPLVKGFARARHKAFATEAEARAFVTAAPSLASAAAHNAAARMTMGGHRNLLHPDLGHLRERLRSLPPLGAVRGMLQPCV
jgi:hypothetical protein